MAVAFGTRKNADKLIGLDYWIRVRSFCRHPCHRQSVSAHVVHPNALVSTPRGVHRLPVARMTSAQCWCLGCGKSSASVLSRPKHTILAYP